MAKINLSVPNSPFHATIDSDVMEVTVREAFLGVKFVTEKGEELTVVMRDGGYELTYASSKEDKGIPLGLQNGTVTYG